MPPALVKASGFILAWKSLNGAISFCVVEGSGLRDGVTVQYCISGII
jgi:hypothetical protein